MYVCMVVTYGQHSKSKDQPGKEGCQSCSWSAEQGQLIFTCPGSRLRIWSREMGSAVPSLVSLLISILKLNLVLGALFTCFFSREISQRTQKFTRYDKNKTPSFLHEFQATCQILKSTFPINRFKRSSAPQQLCTPLSSSNTQGDMYVCVCVCFLAIHSGHQVRWTYQPGSHRRKVTQDFSSTFFLRCVP